MNDNFFTNLYTKEQKILLQTKIDYLGSKNKLNLNIFIFKRIIYSLIIFIISIIFEKWILGFILALIFYYLYEIFTLDIKINKRINVLEKDSLFVFEMLFLEVDNSSSLKKSLRIIKDTIDNSLTEEINIILENLNLGKSFKESVDSCLKYIPSIHVKTVLNSLKDSYELGSPIKKTIANILDYLKDKIYYSEKENIVKIPIKFWLTTIFILVPIIILLILTPYLVSLI